MSEIQYRLGGGRPLTENPTISNNDRNDFSNKNLTRFSKYPSEGRLKGVIERDPQNQGADTAGIIIIPNGQISFVGDGVGSSDDILARKLLEEIIGKYDFTNYFTECKTKDEFITASDRVYGLISKTYKAKADQLKIDENYADDYVPKIACSFIFSSREFDVTYIKQAGDTMVFNESGDLLIPPDTQHSQIINKATNPESIGFDRDDLAKELLSLKTGWEGVVTNNPFIYVLSPDGLLPTYRNIINAAIRQIIFTKTNKELITIYELKYELTQRGCDCNTNLLRVICKKIEQESGFGTNYLNLWTKGFGALTTTFGTSFDEDSQKIIYPYLDKTYICTDGAEKGVVINGESYADPRIWVPMVIAGAKIESVIKKDDFAGLVI